MGLEALTLTLRELVPRLGRPVAVQRELEYALAPGLEWTIQGFLDLETAPPDDDGGEPVPAIVDYKVKNTLHSQAKADHDPQAGLYLAGRWLAGEPAEHFCFAQIGKPGKRRKTMSTRFVVTRRSVARAARHARPDRAGRQPDRRALRPLRPRRALGVRRPERLEVLAALLRPPRPLPRRRRAVSRPTPGRTAELPDDASRAPIASHAPSSVPAAGRRPPRGKEAT